MLPQWNTSISDFLRTKWVMVFLRTQLGSKSCFVRWIILSHILLWRAMSSPPLGNISIWHNQRVCMQQLHLFWIFGGSNVLMSILKLQTFVVADDIPVTVVPHTLIQAPVCLVRRKRGFLKAPWSLTIPWSFASFAASQSFLLSRLPPLTACMWLEV